MKDAVNGGLVTLLIVMALALIVAIGSMVNIIDKFAPMRESIEKCEKDLPRNKHCKIVFEAVVVE